jgi:hypothetical protein
MASLRSIARVARQISILLVLSACTTHVVPSQPYASVGAVVPRPTHVLVADLEVDPAVVRQDQGIGPRLQRSMSGDDGQSDRIALARGVQDAISDAVVGALRNAGLPASRVLPGVTVRPGDVVVTGRVLRIDEGNRTRRLGIGFGAGKSIVRAAAYLSAIAPDGSTILLQSYDGEADSGRRPGLAVGAASAMAESSAAIGALSGVAAAGNETRNVPVEREAARFGNRLARDIGEYAAQHGWISPQAAPHSLPSMPTSMPKP